MFTLAALATTASAQPAWNQSVLHTAGAQERTGPDVVEGADGEIWAAWVAGGTVTVVRWNQDGFNVQASTSLVDLAAGLFNGDLSLAVDGAGAIHLLLDTRASDNLGAERRLLHASFVDGAWSTTDVDTVSNGNGRRFYSGSQLVRVDGGLRAAWVAHNYNNNTHELLYASFDGNSWTSESVASVTGDDTDLTSPSLAVSENGDPHLTFVLQPSGTPEQLHYATRDNGWSSEVALTADGLRPGEPNSLVLSGNQPVVLAYDRAGDRVHIGRKINDTWTFTPVSAEGAAQGRGASLARTADGRLVAAWLADDNNDLIVATSEDGVAFTVERRVTADDSTPHLATAATALSRVAVVAERRSAEATTLDVMVANYPNHPPTVDPQELRFEMLEDDVLNFFHRASDPNGDPIQWSVHTDPSEGEAVLNTNGPEAGVTYTPPENYNGTQVWNYAVTDSFGAQTLVEVTVVVQPVNDRPVIAGPDNYNIQMSEDGDPTPFAMDPLVAMDIDGDDLNWTIGQPPASGQATVTDGVVAYTPPADFNGAVVFTVVVSDGAGGTDAVGVRVEVAPRNDAPTVEEDEVRVTMSEDGDPTPFALNLSANDIDGDELRWSISGEPGNGTADIEPIGDTVAVSYTPSPDFNGEDTFTARVTDGVETVDVRVIVTVEPVNDAPVIEGPDVLEVVMSEDADPIPFRLDPLNASDVDGNNLIWLLGRAPENGEAAVEDGVVTYAPNANFSGNDAFVIRVSDRNGGSDQVTVRVEVTPVNDPPVVENAEVRVTMSEDGDPTPFALTVAASDLDGDVLRWSISDAPASGDADVQPEGDSVVVRYAPTPDFHGEDAFTVQVTDGEATADVRVLVTVEPINDAPIIEGPEVIEVTMSEDGDPVPFDLPTLAAADVDGDDLSWTIAEAAQSGDAAVENGAVTYAPFPNFAGADAFTVMVADGNGGADTVSIQVTVLPVNDPPTVANTEVRVAMSEDGDPIPFELTLEADDADGDELSWSILEQAGNGTAAVPPSGLQVAVSYDVNPDFTGEDEFTVRVTDGQDPVDIRVVVLVDQTNDIPVIAGDNPVTVDMSEDGDPTPFALSLTASDAEDDPATLQWSIVTQPGAGEAGVDATGETVEVSYAPNANSHGEDSFEVQVVDSEGATASVVVNVTIEPVNDAPTDLTLSANTVAEEAPAGTAVGTAAVQDVDEGDLHEFTVDHELFTFVGSELQTTGAVPAEPSQYTVTITATDAGGLEVSGEFTIDVTAVDNPPTAIALDPSEVAENAEVGTIVGTLTAEDPDSDVFTFSFVEGDGDTDNDLFVLDGDTLSTGAEFDFEEAPERSIRVRVEADGQGFEAALVVTILDVEEPPVADDDAYAVQSSDELVVDAPGVLNNDTPGDSGGALTAAVVDEPMGTLTLAEDGGFTYTSPVGFVGEDSFTYVAVEAGVESAPATVVIAVTAEPVLDRDEDGVLDDVDNCVEIPNPDQADQDEDGKGDVCDDDVDGDDVLNDDDNCVMDPNTDQMDLDEDGEGDLCDDDVDGDDVVNDADNCEVDENADQGDLDEDGVGDLCDDDLDGDEIANEDDNCPVDANADQSDADSDGVGDACDDTPTATAEDPNSDCECDVSSSRPRSGLPLLLRAVLRLR